MTEEVNISEPAASCVALVIFVARESLNVFSETLEAACRAMGDDGTIDILVNGNPELAQNIKKVVQQKIGNQSFLRVRVWSLVLGDKANAWNTYLHRIWEGEDLAFFIDGYVRLHQKSLQQLLRSLKANPQALGGTGVPTTGRSAKEIRTRMLIEGGFYGNLCCVKGLVIAEIRRRKIRIPLGLYRVDSLMGAMLYFGLNPKEHIWQTYRIIVDGEASWDLDLKQWWRWSDLMAKKKQIERQLRGSVENAAVKFFFKIVKEKPELLPGDCQSLVQAWEHQDPAGFREFVFRHPLAAMVYWRYRQQTLDWSAKDDLSLLVQMPNRQKIRGKS